jgi:hypothetical protein
MTLNFLFIFPDKKNFIFKYKWLRLFSLRFCKFNINYEKIKNLYKKNFELINIKHWFEKKTLYIDNRNKKRVFFFTVKNKSLFNYGRKKTKIIIQFNYFNLN